MRQPSRTHPTQHLQRVAAFTLLAAAVLSTAPTASPLPGTAPFSMESDAPLQQYRALRKMHARSEKLNHEGWMDAWTELDAKGFRYQVISERGSGTIRGRVLKALLERERELVASGDTERSDLTPANYE